MLNTKKYLRVNKLVSVFLTIAMLIGMLPTLTLTAFAAGEVCEVWNGDTKVGEYNEVGVGISAWLLAAASYDGVVLKLLDWSAPQSLYQLES